MDRDREPLIITPEDALMLAGRLDDVPGADTPRERFRRLLSDRVVDIAGARALLDQWQHAAGEQHHRALQDTIVVSGRFLGFEISFGSYEPIAGAIRYDGQWRLRRRLHLVVEIRSDQRDSGDLESLTRSASALAATALDPGARTLGMFVTLPDYAGRDRLEAALAEAGRHPDLRIASLDALLFLADLVAAGTTTPDALASLFISTTDIDVVVDLMKQCQQLLPREAAPELRKPLTLTPMPSIPAPNHWLAIVVEEETDDAETFVASWIGRRQLLPVSVIPDRDDTPQINDRVAVFVPETGVVGHAQIAALEERANAVRRSDRFARVWRMKNVELYDAAVRMTLDRQRRWLTTLGRVDSGPVLLQISRAEFTAITRSGSAAIAN